MFEKAVREKYRFPFRGACSVEDLWDLGVESLDVIYKHLSREAKAQGEESLLTEKSEANETLASKIAIVKYVVSVKLTERQERQDAAKKAAQKQKILAIIESKQDAALTEMSLEELQGLVNGL